MSPQFDLRDLAATDPANRHRHRPTELSAIQREILRLHKTGLQPRDLAVLFGLNDADVRLLLFGPDEPGAV